jgi:hypothetical protein
MEGKRRIIHRCTQRQAYFSFTFSHASLPPFYTTFSQLAKAVEKEFELD